ATSPTLTLANVANSDLASYRVKLTTSAGSTFSAAAPLTSPIPVVVDQPVAHRAVLGASVQFEASASGEPPLAFQWRKDGTVITGATNSTLVLPVVAAGDAATYSVAVSNSSGTTPSNGAALTVLTPDNVVWTQFGFASGTQSPARLLHD